ncbi:MAG TPA: phytanoyl-CoA dioxygenase family protein [Bryobacteraceae bacterium]|nr:phytanoyl-CoA dioxygenase family protein [Bryobacteraceae bacterium]
MLLDPELVETFQRDGVVSLGQVLDSTQLNDLRERLDRLCLDNEGNPQPEIRNLADLLDGASPQSVLQRVNLYQVDEIYGALARRPDFLDVVEAAVGPDIRLFRDQCFYKPPHCGGEVYMHQDNRYWHLDPPNAVVLFVALDDCTKETGCVHFIKGSHRWGRIEHVRARQGTSILLEAVADKANSVPLELPAGHASLHHCQTLHWSPPNQSSKPRRAHTIEYVAAGVRCRGELLLQAPLLRGSYRAEETRRAGLASSIR